MNTVAAVSSSSTPLLDRIQPLPTAAEARKKSALDTPWARAAIGAAVGGGSLLAFALWDIRLVRSLAHAIGASVESTLATRAVVSDPAILIACLVAAMYAVITVHEIGHAVAGKLAGFRCISIRVGPLKFDPPLRISLYRGPARWTGGHTIVEPIAQRHPRVRTIVLLAGGPLANLASGTLALTLPLERGPFFVAFVFWSFAIGLVNLLLPARYGATLSDSAGILMALRDGPRTERLLALLTLHAEQLRRLPPESISTGALAKATAVEDDSMETVVGHAYAYARAFQRRENEDAARFLETCLRQCGGCAPILREALASDAVSFQALRRGRLDLAEQWFATLPEPTALAWLRPRSEAALCAGRGDVAGSLQKLDEAEKAISAMPRSLQRDLSFDSVRRLREELTNARTLAPA